MTGSVYGFGWPGINPVQSTPWGSPFGAQGFGAQTSPLQQPQVFQFLQHLPQQLQSLQQLTYLQQQQLQQIQQLLVLIPQQFQQAVQQIAYFISQQQQHFQQHPPQSGAGIPFQTVPFGQHVFPAQPGHVM
jgi:hypothetical protein